MKTTLLVISELRHDGPRKVRDFADLVLEIVEKKNCVERFGHAFLKNFSLFLQFFVDLAEISLYCICMDNVKTLTYRL